MLRSSSRHVSPFKYNQINLIYFLAGKSARCQADQQVIFTEVAKFQKAVGTLTNLPAEFQED